MPYYYSPTMKNRKSLSHTSSFLSFVIWKHIAHGFFPSSNHFSYVTCLSQRKKIILKKQQSEKKNLLQGNKTGDNPDHLAAEFLCPGKSTCFASISTGRLCGSLRQTSAARCPLTQSASLPCVPPLAVLGTLGLQSICRCWLFPRADSVASAASP